MDHGRYVHDTQCYFEAGSTFFGTSHADSYLFLDRYLKNIDRFQSSHVACFMTGTGMKFLLLFNPDASAVASSRPQSSASQQRISGGGASVAFNPASAASEESMRAFFADVFENWVKTTMNPFYKIDMEIRSPEFRQRVAVAAKKLL